MLRAMIRKIKSIIPSVPFKIVDIHGNPELINTKIKYQVSGKKTVVTGKPSQLVSELMEIKGFSKEDSDLIYALDHAEKNSFLFKFKSISFDQDKVQFEVHDVTSGNSFYLTGSEIISCTTIWMNLSPTDLAMLYHQLSEERQREIERMRSQLIGKLIYKKEENIYFLNHPRINQ